jgi:hypothetical protein
MVPLEAAVFKVTEAIVMGDYPERSESMEN